MWQWPIAIIVKNPEGFLLSFFVCFPPSSWQRVGDWLDFILILEFRFVCKILGPFPSIIIIEYDVWFYAAKYNEQTGWLAACPSAFGARSRSLIGPLGPDD